jgi:tetratricopeptide (TPR) repeat protein
MRQVILAVFAIVFSIPLSGQKIRTIGDNSPVVVADTYKAEYGMHPHIVLELIKVYDSEGLLPEERNGAVEELIKNYKSLKPQGKQLSEDDKAKLGTNEKSLLSSILDWDLFLELSTSGKNSPIVHAPDGYVEIWYGIQPTAFKGLWRILEENKIKIHTQESTIEGLQRESNSIQQQLAEQVEKFKELKEELASRTVNHEFLSQARELLNQGDLEGAESMLLKYDKLQSTPLAEVKFEIGLIKELRLKYEEATEFFQLAALLDKDNAKYSFYYGNNLIDVANYNEGIIYFRKSLDVLESIPEIDSSEFAIRYNNLGHAYEAKGEYAKAISYYLDALRIDTTIYGKNHAYVANRYNNLGSVSSTIGKYDRAISYYQSALQILQNIHIRSHPLLAACYGNLGSTYSQKGEYERAIPYFLGALKILLNGDGESYPVAFIYNQLGLNYDYKGEYDEALSCFQSAIKVLQNIYKEPHPHLARCYNNLGGIYSKKGEYERAIPYFLDAMRIDSIIFGKNNPSVITSASYNLLGLASKSKGEYDKAILYFKDATRISQSFYGESHPDVATEYNNLGVTYHSKGEYDQAILYFQDAIQIDTTVYGRNHPSVSRDYNNLGIAFFEQGEYDQAILYYQNVLQIDTTIYGKNHPSVAKSYNHLGGAFFKKREFNRAIYYFRNALQILLKFSDPKRPTLKVWDTINNLGQSYYGAGMFFYDNQKYDNANKMFQMAYFIGKGVKDSSFLITCANSLGSSFRYLSKADSGLIYLNEGIGIAEKLNQDFYRQAEAFSDSIREHPAFPVYIRQNSHDDILQQLYFNKAGCLCQLGKKKEAKAILQQLKIQAKKDKNKAFIKEINSEKCK